MNMLKFITNASAIASLASIGLECGESAVRNAKKSGETALAVKDIKDITGDSMLKESSEKYNSMKKIVRNSSFTPGLHKTAGTVSGFLKGAGQILKNNVAQIGFAIVTLSSNNKNIKAIGAIGTGISALYDFIKNGTNLFQKKNIIEK